MIIIYHVKTIKYIEQMKECPVFDIKHYQWTKEYKPKAFGQMAIIDNYGVIVSMTAIESNPLRRYTQENDPVYKDSALEAFLDFSPEHNEKGYLNFEMNANGAMLSEFGVNRNRRKIKELTSFRVSCEAKIEQDSWNVVLKIPMELIRDIYQRDPLIKGDFFTCNFYKISEDPELEHYASYSPIVSPTPNFHLLNYFGSAVID